MKKIGYIFIVLIIIACNKKQENENTHNFSDDYAYCNTQLSECLNESGQYCLFGFKWGADNPFNESGSNAQGPRSNGGVVTFSFQEENGVFNTHRQTSITSKSFNNLLPCAKDEIRNALDTWSSIANIEFEELPYNSESDIRFYVGDIVQSGIGYPNYPDNLCRELAGNVVIQTNIKIKDCDLFFAFVLHEIGHVLGLGHVNTKNIMNPNFYDLDLQELHSGDSLGILEIYGAKAN